MTGAAQVAERNHILRPRVGSQRADRISGPGGAAELSIHRDDLAARSETAGCERLAGAGLGLAIVGDDIQKGLHTGFDACIRAVAVKLQGQGGLAAHDIAEVADD